MATKKVKSQGARLNKKVAKKKTPVKKTAKKVAKKKVVKKKAAAPGRAKGSFKIGDNITVVKGMEDTFYKKFPRYAAYMLLLKAGTMKTATFVDKIERLEGVHSRQQALGILTKLISKGCAKSK